MKDDLLSDNSSYPLTDVNKRNCDLLFVGYVIPPSHDISTNADDTVSVYIRKLFESEQFRTAVSDQIFSSSFIQDGAFVGTPSVDLRSWTSRVVPLEVTTAAQIRQQPLTWLSLLRLVFNDYEFGETCIPKGTSLDFDKFTASLGSRRDSLVRSYPQGVPSETHKLLSESKYFDAEFYYERYPDVALANTDAVSHYILHGGVEGRIPSALFDSLAYMQDFPSVHAAGIPPLLHYLEHGEADGLRIRRPELAPDEHYADQIVRTKFDFLRPLALYYQPRSKPRVTMVTDSINSGWLYGGVGTALLLTALLAKERGATLRIATQDIVPERENVARVLRANGIEWDEDAEFVTYNSRTQKPIFPITDDEIFVTTSWWSTAATLRAVPKSQIIYALQEDERMFYAMGDDQLRCAEVMATSGIRFAINSKLLYDHLISSGLDNISDFGHYFEPAFPENNYFYKKRQNRKKKRFFFYSRPNNERNLYTRGLEVINEAISQGVLDNDNWELFFVGKDVRDIVLRDGIRPKVVDTLSWVDYGKFIRTIDLGLSLMYTPHPSYPPLDLAASGAVVVTNRFGVKQDLSGYCRNIICGSTDVDDLVKSLALGSALVDDTATREDNYRMNNFSRSWIASLSPVVKALDGDI
ncbi:rhamnosyltransferase WsaF family glycosyltransferase [Sphingomonas sp. UYP23]